MSPHTLRQQIIPMPTGRDAHCSQIVASEWHFSPAPDDDRASHTKTQSKSCSRAKHAQHILKQAIQLLLGPALQEELHLGSPMDIQALSAQSRPYTMKSIKPHTGQPHPPNAGSHPYSPLSPFPSKRHPAGVQCS